jgi:uncharacterized protein YeaO (DUF488 family)
MPVVVKRAYEKPTAEDGYRVLVDRLWPRGLTKVELELDAWLQSVAPSAPLRQAFHLADITWGEFRIRYLAELKPQRDELRRLMQISRKGRLTLVFAAKDPERNNAVVLKQYLRMLGAG